MALVFHNLVVILFFIPFQIGQSVSLVPFIGCFPQRSQSSGKMMHAWELILKYYELKNGENFNATPARKLSQSFNLDLTGNSTSSNKEVYKTLGILPLTVKLIQIVSAVSFGGHRQHHLYSHQVQKELRLAFQGIRVRCSKVSTQFLCIYLRNIVRKKFKISSVFLLFHMLSNTLRISYIFHWEGKQ